MKDKIENMLKDIEALKLQFKDWCKDKTIPLDERWNTFIKSDLGYHDSNYWHFETFDSDEYHDGEYVRKFQTCTPNDVIEEFSKNNRCSKFINESDYEMLVIKFKEEVLNNFIKSWVFDW